MNTFIAILALAFSALGQSLPYTPEQGALLIAQMNGYEAGYAAGLLGQPSCVGQVTTECPSCPLAGGAMPSTQPMTLAQLCATRLGARARWSDTCHYALSTPACAELHEKYLIADSACDADFLAELKSDVAKMQEPTAEIQEATRAINAYVACRRARHWYQLWKPRCRY